MQRILQTLQVFLNGEEEVKGRTAAVIRLLSDRPDTGGFDEVLEITAETGCIQGETVEKPKLYLYLSFREIMAHIEINNKYIVCRAKIYYDGKFWSYNVFQHFGMGEVTPHDVFKFNNEHTGARLENLTTEDKKIFFNLMYDVTDSTRQERRDGFRMRLDIDRECLEPTDS